MLECLQKALRIANSVTEEIVTVQLYCDTLDRYLYYLDRGAPAVRILDIRRWGLLRADGILRSRRSS